MGIEWGFTKLFHKNYFSLVVDLLEYIKAKPIAVGEKLPDENTLAQDLHASRPTLREALKVLEAFGITESKRGSGNTYVKSSESGFSALFALYALVCGNRGIVDFISMRATIEASAIDSFLTNATEADIQHLDRLYHEHLFKVVPSEAYVQHHIEFHQYLLKYYQNQMAEDFVAASIRLSHGDYRKSAETLPLQDDDRAALKLELQSTDHRKILEALFARDLPLCKELVLRHILVPTHFHPG